MLHGNAIRGNLSIKLKYKKKCYQRLIKALTKFSSNTNSTYEAAVFFDKKNATISRILRSSQDPTAVFVPYFKVLL